MTIHNIDDQLGTTILPNCVTIHNADNQLDINTLPNCVTNHEKQRAIHSVEKETPANDHTLSDCMKTVANKVLLVQGKETILLTI